MKGLAKATSLLLSLALAGCGVPDAWRSERQAAHDSATERTERIGGTVETLSGARRTVTTETTVDGRGRPVVTETVETEPGDRRLMSFNLSLGPESTLEVVLKGDATLDIGIKEPAASMMNAFNDSLVHANVSPDELMRTFAPALAQTLQALGIAGFGTWGIVELSKNNQPLVVEQPPAQVIEQPEPIIIQ